MYRVYVIEIMAKWFDIVAPNLPAGRRCYYVGETGKTLGERYREHRTPKTVAGRREKRAAAVFAMMRKHQGERPLKRTVDVKLRRTISDLYREVATREESEALEQQVIDYLRSEGHAVFPKGPGLIPFGNYRS